MAPPAAALADLLDRATAAQELGVGPDYLSTRLRERLPPVLDGRHPHWHRAHLDAHKAGRPLPTVEVPAWLVDRDGVAELLGVQAGSVTRYLTRHRATVPPQVLTGWYDAREITAWKAGQPTGPGRPRKTPKET
jgi:hypothetical protein